MKFLCSNCKAKYQIPDEKIAGRTLKMDCRRCNTPITIRGDQPQIEDLDSAIADEPEPQRSRPATSSGSASMRSRPAGPTLSRPAGASTTGSSVGAHPAGAGLGSARSTTGRSALGADFRRNVGAAGLSAAPEAPRVTPLDQWHVAINDVPVGPMKRDEISRKIAAGAANADSLAWREGFDDWRPIREIPELAALLRRATAESERPAGRPGGRPLPAAPPPRAPAPRAGMPAPGPRSPLGPTPAARPAARNNVVPIGGRLGASAAPSFDLEDGDEIAGEGESTTIASAADLGLADFGKPARDDGDIPVAPAARREEPRKEAAPRAGMTGGLKPIPPPSAKPAARVAPAPAPKPAPAKPAPAKPTPAAARVAPAPLAPAVAPAIEEEEDDGFGLPPIELPPKRASFAPAPVLEAPQPAAAPLAKAVPVATPREERRSGVGVGAMMGIGFAMAAGAVLMYAVVQRFVLSPPPPTTSIVATVATIAPPPTDAQREAVMDDSVQPPSSAIEAPPTTDVAPPPGSTVAGTGVRRPGTPATATTGAGARSASKVPAGDDPFANFADDGAGPAPIASASTTHRDDDPAAHHSSAELTSDQIGRVVRGGQRGLTTCWETALRAAGHVDGDVRYNMDITIGTSGRVTSVTARGPTMANLQECLERGVRRWVFPSSGSETQTSFPLVFSAQQ